MARHYSLAASRGTRLLVQCVAVNVRFSLALFKEGAGNVFLGHSEMCHI